MCSNEMSAINITGDTITIARICGFFFFFLKKEKNKLSEHGGKKKV
jgi:hypothetical protein